MIGLVWTMLIPVLAACTKQAAETDNTVRTLRFASSIVYIGTNGEVFREYTEMFEYEHGFSFTNYASGISNLFANMTAYVQPLGMNWIDVDTLQMTVNTPKWQEVWTTFTDLYKEGVLPLELSYKEYTGPFDGDLFLSGRAAMVSVPYNYLYEVVQANPIRFVLMRLYYI